VVRYRERKARGKAILPFLCGVSIAIEGLEWRGPDALMNSYAFLLNHTVNSI
jgi:hypothetical protein